MSLHMLSAQAMFIVILLNTSKPWETQKWCISLSGPLLDMPRAAVNFEIAYKAGYE